jgi:exodeoxyribonuclease V beta subunit
LRAASPHIEWVAAASTGERASPVPVRAVVPPADLEAVIRHVPSEQLRSWSVSSFTQLTSGASHDASLDEHGILDDAEGRVASEDPMQRADQLPPGAHTGNALHAIFEALDFTRVSDAQYVDAIVTDVLDAYALPRVGATPEQRSDAADLTKRMIAQTLTTPIGSAGAVLATVPFDATLREWRFHLPMSALRTSALARAFQQHGNGWLSTQYAPRLARVSSRQLDGFLTGVVDLVAHIDGRWWVVDWKSNILGASPTSYDTERCRGEMMSAHYVLQYHLYVVALHRFLKARCGAQYDYARDIGGVGYAFLRGLASGVPAWFHDRPSPDLIAALDDAIGGRAS